MMGGSFFGWSAGTSRPVRLVLGGGEAGERSWFRGEYATVLFKASTCLRVTRRLRSQFFMAEA